jgi:dephospho-CoA kinase
MRAKGLQALTAAEQASPRPEEEEIPATPEFKPDIFIVVLTGGIASGKTVVSDGFSKLGVPVIDTDLIAHEIVEPGQPALSRIIEVFGKEFLDDNGGLNRRRMREAIFSDPGMKSRLESILHPAIARESMRRIAALKAPYCIFVVPLFTESGLFPWVNRVLVVDSDEALQIERVIARDRIGEKQARAILAAQPGRTQRLAMADEVIDNSGSLEPLQARIKDLHRKYCRLAART